MRDPVDQIRELIQKGAPGVLEKIACALGYDEAYMAQVAEDRRDAEAFRALTKHCTDLKISFTRDNQVRQVKLLARASSCTSLGFRVEIRKTIDDLAREGLKQWPDGA